MSSDTPDPGPEDFYANRRHSSSNEAEHQNLEGGEEEIGDVSVKTRIFRAFGMTSMVIAGLAVVALVIIIGGFFDWSHEFFSTKPGTDSGFVGLFYLLVGLGAAFVLLPILFVGGSIILTFLGVGMIASSKTDNPEKRGTVAKVARGCGITILCVLGLVWIVAR